MTDKAEKLIDAIARQTQEIVTNMATKKDLEELVTKTDFEKKLEDTRDEIVTAFEKLVKDDLKTYVDLIDLNVRLKAVEERLGINR
jgi:uncharacterized protein YcaQ